MAAVDQNLWVGPIQREQLVEMLDGRGPRPNRASESDIRRLLEWPGLVGIWSADEEQLLSPLPNTIIGKREVLEDLFAWSATYLRALGPLSSISRIITPEQFVAIVDRRPPKVSWEIAGGAVGLIVSEVMALGDGIDIDTAAAATPTSTLSFAIFRAWALGLPARSIDEISNTYTYLSREIHGSATDHIRGAAAEMAASLMASNDVLVGRKDRVNSRYRRWISELRKGANIYDVARDVLSISADFIIGSEVGRLAEMTAEARVEFFDAFSSSLFQSKATSARLDQAFALAFAAFICRPGLEQQASILAEHAKLLPEAWLCLGALQAFTPIGDALLIGSGAGWRIAREIYRSEDPWAAPRADASFVEMRLLAGTKSKLVQRLMSKSRFDVEIYPLISIALRGGGSTAGKQQILEDRSLIAVNERATMAKLESIEARLEDALRAVRDIRREREPSSNRYPRRRR